MSLKHWASKFIRQILTDLKQIRTQINKIRVKEGRIIVETNEIQRVNRRDFKVSNSRRLKVYTKWINSWGQTDDLARKKLREYKQLWNIYSNQWDSSNNKDPPNKVKSKTEHIYYRSFPNLYKANTPMLLKLLHKMEREETLPHSFYEARITWIIKTR